MVREELLYAREKNKAVEDLILFEYTIHADPDNKNTTRLMLMEVFGDSIFDAPVMFEAKALAKVNAQVSLSVVVLLPGYAYPPVGEIYSLWHAFDRVCHTFVALLTETNTKIMIHSVLSKN